VAECHHQGDPLVKFANLMTRHVDQQLRKALADAMGYSYVEKEEEEEEAPEPPPYSFPHEGCDCGIYGSVNLEEVSKYMVAKEPNNMLITLYDRNPIGERVLCVIEPSEDADVILARKGWRAGAAFVSEIIGETITIDEASTLLSIAWHREIDLRRLYENR